MVELVGLLMLLAVATVVYAVTGPAGFSSIVSAGGGLFATWRAFRAPERTAPERMPDPADGGAPEGRREA
ncbi:hypothetical protein ACYTFC_31115 [Streptomyces globosus]|uniref:hypothetical protein n=1 Tax=Streptomyces globosus TaxID=68209 RepID=UPI0031D85ADC